MALVSISVLSRCAPCSVRAAARAAAARAVEVFLHPRMVELLDLRQRRADQHLAVGEHRDAVADRVQRVEIVGDQEHGQAERLLQGAGSARRRRRRRSGRGRRSARRGTAAPDPAPARAPGRRACACRRTAARATCSARRPAGRRAGSSAAPVRSAASRAGRGGAPSAAPARSRRRSARRTARRSGTARRCCARSAGASSGSSERASTPSTSISPSSGVRRPRIERISTDLPVPEPPTTPMISPRLHVQVEVVVHDLLAEAVGQAAHADDRLGVRGVGAAGASALTSPSP